MQATLLNIEGDRVWRVDTGDIFEMKHRDKVASIWFCGVPIIHDSAIVYRYLSANENVEMYVNLPKPEEKQ